LLANIWLDPASASNKYFKYRDRNQKPNKKIKRQIGRCPPEANLLITELGRLPGRSLAQHTAAPAFRPFYIKNAPKKGASGGAAETPDSTNFWIPAFVDSNPIAVPYSLLF
jgi:hypothetical protein